MTTCVMLVMYAGDKRKRGEDVHLVRAETDFFLEFAVGALLDGFVAIQPAFRQTEFVAFDARAVFAHEQDRVVILHRHDDHGAEAGAFQALVGAFLAVGEFQVEEFDFQEVAAVCGFG